jgi:serine/threonine protein phosphatase PrpC
MGANRSKLTNVKDSHNGENGFIKFGVSSMQGWRESMEDAYISLPDFTENISLFAIFDGHGGAEVARFCAKYFPAELLKNVNFKQGKYKLALEETFLKMDTLLFDDKNSHIIQQLKNDLSEQISFAGCTAHVVVISNENLFIANAGDSRSVIFTSLGDVISLSKDHKPDLDSERIRINKAGGYVSDGRVNDNLNLSRAIGDLQFKRNPALGPEQQIISAFPDVVVHSLEKTDKFMLIGCDGIWESLSSKKICEFIEGRIQKNSSFKLSTILEELLDKLIAKDPRAGAGCDNMTAILIRFKN